MREVFLERGREASSVEWAEVRQAELGGRETIVNVYRCHRFNRLDVHA